MQSFLTASEPRFGQCLHVGNIFETVQLLNKNNRTFPYNLEQLRRGSSLNYLIWTCDRIHSQLIGLGCKCGCYENGGTTSYVTIPYSIKEADTIITLYTSMCFGNTYQLSEIYKDKSVLDLIGEVETYRYIFLLNRTNLTPDGRRGISTWSSLGITGFLEDLREGQRLFVARLCIATYIGNPTTDTTTEIEYVFKPTQGNERYIDTETRSTLGTPNEAWLRAAVSGFTRLFV